MKIMKRGSFKPIPISTDIINRINSITINGHQSSSAELIIGRGHTNEIVEDDGQDETTPDPLLIQPIVHQIHPSNTPAETAFQSDDDSDDSTYQPSHDGDDVEWEADSDEEPHEQNGMSTYPDSTLSHTLSPSTSNNSHSCSPSPETKPETISKKLERCPYFFLWILYIYQGTTQTIR
jgi:hypothetical protein